MYRMLSALALGLLTTLVGCKTCETRGADAGSVIEVVTFKLKPGVTTSEFLQLDRAVEREYVARQAGFVSRQSAAGDDGEWLVIVHWESVEDADAAMASFPSARPTKEFMSKLDVTTMSMNRYSNFHR